MKRILFPRTLTTERLARGAAEAKRNARRAARSLGNAAVGLTARTARGRTRTGLLSVVVPFYGVEKYFDACLRSLRDQEYRHLELILVDDGSPDASIDIARRHAAKDLRIRIIRQRNAGLSAARNTGAAHAVGEFITFVDSDDVVRPETYRVALDSLRRTGSDFALFGYSRLKGKTVKAPAAWIRSLHDAPAQRVTVQERPDAMYNAVAWSKVYRRQFFETCLPPFPVGQLYEDQPVSAAAFAHASAFDILGISGIEWRIREDASSISQQEHEVSNLRAQMDAGLASIRVLEEAGLDQAAQARAEQILSKNLNFYTSGIAAEHEGQDLAEFRSAYSGYAEDLMARVGQERAAEIMSLRQRLIYRLADRISIQDMRRAEDMGYLKFNEHPIVRDDDGYFLDSPLLSTRPYSDHLTRHDLRLGAADMTLSLGLHNHWLADGALHLQGWAYRAGRDLDVGDGVMTAWLQARDGTRVPVDLQRFFDPRIDERSGHHFCDYRGGGFRAVVPLARLVEAGRGEYELHLELDLDGSVQQGRPGKGNRWEPIRVATTTHAGTPVSVTARSGPLVVGVGDAAAVAEQGQFRSRTPGALESVAAHDDGFTVRVRLSSTADIHGFRLEGPGVSVPGTLVEDYRGIVTVRFPNTTTMWGRSGVPLPSGNYYLRVKLSQNAQSKDFWVPESLAADLPMAHLTRDHRVTVRSRNHHSRTYPVIQIGAPKATEELGWRNHERLVAKYRDTPPSHEGFFFRSLYGEVTNCNGLGVHQELRRQGLDVPVYWSVADRCVPVPPGGIGVVEGTEAWHQAIRAARHLLVNVHQHPWYRKVEGQQIIETFHGYPYKLMGHQWWDFRGFPARQVAEFDARARDWDYVVSPAGYASPLLSAAFLEPAGSTAELLEIGYPRNDVLLRPDEVGALRTRTRSLLSIRDQAKVVLFAPTFRDYLSEDDMTAEFQDLLDVNRLADALGEDYVLLMRGHPFNARGKSAKVSDAARIVDVTTYPDINDLYAASDAAILDYSSARFDYALTDKPAVFFVPDAVQYHQRRPGLMDFRDTAPGPLLSRPGEVVSALTDLDRLHRDFAAARAEFRNNYAELDDGHAGERLLAVLGVNSETSRSISAGRH